MDEGRVEIRDAAEAMLDAYRAQAAEKGTPDIVLAAVQSALCVGLALAFSAVPGEKYEILCRHFMDRAKDFPQL